VKVARKEKRGYLVGLIKRTKICVLRFVLFNTGLQNKVLK